MRGQATIRDGQLYYSQDIMDYINANEGAECDIEIVAMNKPEHYLYKWLFGFLIKEVALHTGNSIDDIKDAMKAEFATVHVENWEDIPKRHRKKCQRYEQINESGEVTDRWYVKSCSSMSHDELLEFNKNCEMHFFDFMSSQIMKSRKAEEAYENRKKGHMNTKALRRYNESTRQG